MSFAFVVQLTIILFSLHHIEASTKTAKTRKFYHIESEENFTWSESSEFCKKMGLNLVNIRDEDEFTFLKTILRQRNVHNMSYWMGAYRYDGVFRWLPSNAEIKVFRWHEGEPNDLYGVENCINTWGADFDWNDNDCDRKYAFICEGEENYLLL